MFVLHSRRAGVKRRRRKEYLLEGLELRRLLAAPSELLQYHNDSHSTGNNLTETILTPGNVNSTTFGLKSRTALDGQVYGQPLRVRLVDAASRPVSTPAVQRNGSSPDRESGSTSTMTSPKATPWAMQKDLAARCSMWSAIVRQPRRLR